MSTPPKLITSPTAFMQKTVAKVDAEIGSMIRSCAEHGYVIHSYGMHVEIGTKQQPMPGVPRAFVGDVMLAPCLFAVFKEMPGIDDNEILRKLLQLEGAIPDDLVMMVTEGKKVFLGYAIRDFGIDPALIRLQSDLFIASHDPSPVPAVLSSKSIAALRWAALTNEERLSRAKSGNLPYEEDLAEGFLPLEMLGLVSYELYMNPRNLPDWRHIVLDRYGVTSTPSNVPAGTMVASGGGGVVVLVILTDAGKKEAARRSSKESLAN